MTRRDAVPRGKRAPLQAAARSLADGPSPRQRVLDMVAEVPLEASNATGSIQEVA